MVDLGEVDDPRAYLFRLVGRQSLDQVRRNRRARERADARHVPEPTVPDGAAEIEAVSTALAPVERVVFLLREAFGFSHAEIAGILGRTKRAVRQFAYRARRHLTARRHRYQPAPDEHREITERLRAAVHGIGDPTTHARSCEQ